MYPDVTEEAKNAQEFEPFLNQTVGPYLLRALIGVGGMGGVFLATHTRLEKRVAVKLIRASHRNQKDAASRFFSEAKAAAAIGHENIIDVFDVGEDPTHGPYLAMEYLEKAESLGALVFREGALPLERVRRIGTQISNALAATHAAGLVHCDLKPSNVLLIRALGQDDVVKLIDFGISRKAPEEDSSPTQSSRLVLGTPAFMSPEQVTGRCPDGRSDQYALGLLVYMMLTGRPPFEGTPSEVMKRQYHDHPPPLRTRRRDVTPSLEEILSKALAKKPEERFPLISTFGEALHRAIKEAHGPQPVPLSQYKAMFEGGTTGSAAPIPQSPPKTSAPPDALSQYKSMFEGGTTGAAPPISTSPEKPTPPATPPPDLSQFKSMFEGGTTGSVEPLPESPPKTSAPRPSLSQYKAMFEGDNTGSALAVEVAPKSPAKAEGADIFSLVPPKTTPSGPPVSAPPKEEDRASKTHDAPPKEPPQKTEVASPRAAPRPFSLRAWLLPGSLVSILVLVLLWSYLSGYVGAAPLPSYPKQPRIKKVVPVLTPSTAPEQNPKPDRKSKNTNTLSPATNPASSPTEPPPSDPTPTQDPTPIEVFVPSVDPGHIAPSTQP